MSLNERVVNVLKNNMWDIAACAAVFLCAREGA